SRQTTRMPMGEKPNPPPEFVVDSPSDAVEGLDPGGFDRPKSPQSGSSRMRWLFGVATTFSIVVVGGLAVPEARAGRPLVSGQLVGGTISPPLFREAWTFTGTLHDRVLISAITTGGPLNTTLYLYAPGGGDPVAIVDDRLDYQLLQSGTYTVVVQDDGL